MLPDTPPSRGVSSARWRPAVVAGQPGGAAHDLAYVVEYVRAAALVTTPAVARDLAAALRAAPWPGRSCRAR